MQQSCDDAEEQICIADDASKSVLECAGKLQDERFISFPHCERTTMHRNTIKYQRTILTHFLVCFTFPEDEANAIAVRCNAMDRTERIRQEGRVLMVGGDRELVGWTWGEAGCLRGTRLDSHDQYCSWEGQEMGYFFPGCIRPHLFFKSIKELAIAINNCGR
jgi:hypothetical protein